LLVVYFEDILSRVSKLKIENTSVTHIVFLRQFCGKKTGLIFLLSQLMFNTKAINTIKEQLIAIEQKVSVAESVTAGFLQAAFASAELALKFFEGGITTYNINQKVQHLKIDKQKGEECNCVSEQTANEMAMGVCELFGTDWGIAITGYATPVPESGFKLFAFFSICYKNQIRTTERIDLSDEKPEHAQLKYVDTITEKFARLLSASKP
jgi:nicotinamide-nucleotide amidase